MNTYMNLHIPTADWGCYQICLEHKDLPMLEPTAFETKDNNKNPSPDDISNTRFVEDLDVPLNFDDTASSLKTMLEVLVSFFKKIGWTWC